MTYLDPSDSIESLGLSRRSFNALSHNGFLTVGQLTEITIDQLHAIRNLGQRSIEEIWERLQTLHVLSEDSTDRILPEPSMQQVTFFYNANGILCEDIPVDKLRLSVRAVNCLNEANIAFASQLMDMTITDLLSIRNMGRKTAEQILERVQTVSFQTADRFSDTQHTVSTADRLCSETINRLKKYLSFNAGTVYEKLSEIFEDFISKSDSISDYELLEKKEVCIRIFAIPLIRDALKAKILEICENSKYGIRCTDICAQISVQASSCGALDETLQELETNDLIWTNDDGLIVRKYISIVEYAQSIILTKDNSFLLGRLNGLTLEEIGKKDGITRERVRQVVQKNLKERPPVSEDIYAEVYQSYNWSEEDFMFAFKELKTTFNYLLAAYDRRRTTDLADLCGDENFPLFFRKAAERVIYKNCITIGNERIPKKRTELVDFVLRTYCENEMVFDDFVKLYEGLLIEWGLDGEQQLAMNARTYENRFSESRNVLWKYGKRFRYYDTEQYDFTELFDILALDQYHDVEYSTLKFFREYPEVMKQYDIRDEYELHNLLKTICTPEQWPEISFNRMPNIAFGKADRNEQVLNLLLQLAPVTRNDFSNAYEQEYGVLARTVEANYVLCIDEYFFDSMYKIDRPALPLEQSDRMKTLLTKDFYIIEDTVRQYLREFPDANRKNINPYTLKMLGFKVYIGYVISEKYDSATDYFRFLITGTDIVDLRERSAIFSSIGGFYAELYKAKSEFEIIEYAPLQFVNIRKLESTGITKEMLRGYSKDVFAYPLHSKYFTISSLRRNGFKHSLDELGFDDWFYASLLSEDKQRFAYCRIGVTKVFCKGIIDFSMKDLIAYIIEQEISIDIEDLMSMLDFEFGFKTVRWKIIELVKNSSMYYNPIMEKIYIDYDTYFEEV